MKKFLKLSVAALMVGGMMSCSSDEPAPVNPAEGQNAYLTVNIQTVGEIGSRATTDGGYQDAVENGTDKAVENKVNNAYFYFFDANGVYAGTANIWNGGTAEGNTSNSVEYIGQNTIVLENVTNNNYPDYVLTVLNKPADFVAPVAGETMASVVTKLANYVNTDGSFVITTSAFYGASTIDHNPAFPWATKIDKQKFQLKPETSKAQPIDIYVERLAAKVELAAKPELSSFEETVFGFENPEQTTGAATKLYVKVNGVGLNGVVANNSYLFKQLDAAWQTAAPFNGWENAGDHRSFYGKSYKYSDAAYAANAVNPAGLTFTNYAALTKQVGDANYCNEYTNKASNLVKDGQVYGDRVTSLCVAATVYSDAACTQALDLVSYNGIYFTKDQYIKYVLGALKNDGKLNFYTKEGNVTTQFNKVELLTWVAAGAGTGTIKINVASDAAVELFDADGNATTVAAFNTVLDTFQANMKATAYNGGKMYYTVPVEHLAATAGTANTAEGYYGLVRNHWYKISINSIMHLGHGVFDTTETIIPDQPEDPYYFLSARINILAWKIVNQPVDL